MKTFPVLSFLMAVVLGVNASCTGPRTGTDGSPTVAIAIRHAGDMRPDERQLAAAAHALQRHLAGAGYRFASSPVAAQFIVTAEYTPSSFDPSGGHVRIVGVEPGEKFRRSAAADASDERKELRQRLEEIERWIQQQSQTRPGEATN